MRTAEAESANRYDKALGEAIADTKKTSPSTNTPWSRLWRKGASNLAPFSVRDVQGVLVQDPWLQSITNLEGAIAGVEEIGYIPRGRCFKGGISSCNPAIDIGLPYLKPYRADRGAFCASACKSKYSTNLLQRVTGSQTFVDDSIFELADSICAPALAETPSLFVAATRKLSEGEQYRMLSFVGDLALLSVDLFPPESGYGAYLRKNGIAWIPMWTGNHYSCPALGHDLGAVLAFEAVAKTVRETPFSISVRASQQER